MPYGFHWNDDFTTYTGTQWTKCVNDPQFARMFVEALNERAYAQQEFTNGTSGNSYGRLPQAGDFVSVLWNISGGTAWTSQFVSGQPTALLSSSTNAPGTIVARSDQYNGQAAAAVGVNQFQSSGVPLTNWTFHRPLEVFKSGGAWLANRHGTYAVDNGTAGEHARYIAQVSGDPLVTGTLWTSNGSTWNAALPAVTGPDVVAYTTSFQGAQIGDYIEPSLFNRMRDEINARVCFGYSSQPSFFHAVGALPSGYGFKISGTTLSYQLGINYTGGMTREVYWLDNDTTTLAPLNLFTSQSFAPTGDGQTIICPVSYPPINPGHNHAPNIVVRFDVTGGFQYTSAATF